MSLQEVSVEGRRGRGKKVTVFESLNSHAKRKFREIDKSVLIIPINEYQRDESGGRVAAEIAMHFDVVAFGVLLVIERADSTMVVADGGTRLSGARKRADISTVPCIVFSGLTAKEEGDVFLRVNCNRRKLQTEQQHHAELFSDHDLAVRTQTLLELLGKARVGFDSLSTMRSGVKANHSAIATVVDILMQAAEGRHVTARVMKALFRLETLLAKQNRTLATRPLIKRISAQFGTFDAVLNSMVAPRQRGSSKDMARALARNLRIKFPERE
jgi:hypothetical protein